MLRALRILLLSASLLLPMTLMSGKSITSDEVAHIPAGYSYLKTGVIKLNPMHPPLIKEICALPLFILGVHVPIDGNALEKLDLPLSFQWTFGNAFLAHQDVERLVFAARIPAVLLSVGLVAVVMVWATELWGPWGGALAGLLYVLDPTLTAHAQLVTTDVGLAFFATLFFYALRRHLKSPSAGRLLFAGATLGLALGAKFSAVLLLPIAGVLAAMSSRNLPKRIFAVLAVGLMAAVAYAMLWVIYLFPRDPLFYLHGLQTVNEDHSRGYLFLMLGKLHEGKWPLYLPIAWLLKTPLPSLILLAASVVVFVRGRRAAWLEEAFLAVPALGFFLANAFFADPIGVRYLIPCFPFFFIFTARLAPAAVAVWQRVAVGVLVAWSLVEFLAIWPDHLSYFNEIAGGPRHGIEWLGDSNVDWGQGLLQLRDYLRDHPVDDFRICTAGSFDPAYYGIRGKKIEIGALTTPPEPGTWILSAHCVAWARAWMARFYGNDPENWLAHAVPKAIVGHAFYVYEISP